MNRLTDAAAFPAWAYQIISNKCRDWVRRKQRQREATEAYFESIQGEEHAAAAAQRRQSTLKEALEQLSGPDRASCRCGTKSNSTRLRSPPFWRFPRGRSSPACSTPDNDYANTWRKSMSEHENELKKALAEEGLFDAGKASNEADGASRWFESRLKWSGRFAWMRIILVVVVFEFAFVKFCGAASTKAMIGYAAMMVCTIVLVGTIAVQSWVAGTKISVLREIKLLRLECLGRPTEQVASSALGAFPVMASPRRLFSLGEYIAWLLALMVVAGAAAFVTQRLSDSIWPSDMARFEGAPVIIEAPRSGAPVYVHVYLRMDQGVCKVSRVTPDRKQSELFRMGTGSWHSGQLSAGDSLRLDPQGQTGEYWVRFE